MYSLKTKDLYDLSHTAAAALLEAHENPWSALPHIKDYVRTLIERIDSEDYYFPSPDVCISKSARVAESSVIIGPTLICEDTEIRTGAFIRGGVIIGRGCVVGNSCEVKNSILFDGVQIPHFNYIGDSILGFKAHTGAGAITSNVKSDKSSVRVKTKSGSIETGFKKFGAMIGDMVEIGCNSVLNPGTVIGKNSTVYPLSSVRGCVPPNSIYKANGEIVPKIFDTEEA